MTHPASKTSAVIVALPQDQQALTVEGGDPADEIHCTLKFLGRVKGLKMDRAQIEEALKRAASAVRPCTVSVTAVGSLGAEEPPATILRLSGGLAGHRSLIEALVKDLPADRFPDWTPHVTQGYGTEPTPELVGTKIVFDRFALWWAGEKVEFPFGN